MFNVLMLLTMAGVSLAMPRAPIGQCPVPQGSVPVFLPDSEDCSRYYECSNGIPVSNSCPDGMHFNPTLSVCDFPIHAGCQVDAEAVVMEARSAVGECPQKDGFYPVYLADSEDCRAFYECSNGVAVRMRCAPGTSFSQFKRCDTTELAKCPAARGSLTSRSAVGQCPVKDGANPTYLPDSSDCSIFYECSGGEPLMVQCPPALEFNPVLHVCDYPERADCTAQQAVRAVTHSAVGSCPPRDGAQPVFLPDSATCAIYYQCSNGVAVQLDCPPNLVFNPQLDVCVDPLDYDCPSSPN